MREAGRGNVDRSGLVVAAEDQLSSVDVGVARPTVAARARDKASGNVFPRLSARRRIPAQAFALKKYRCGTSPVSSVSNNEHTSAALGDSKPLSVQYPVRDPIPEFAQRPEEGAKIPSSCTRQDTGDVFPDDPGRPQHSSKLEESEGQVATRIVQPSTESGDGEGLAGGSSHEKVNWPGSESIKRLLCDSGHVAKVLEPQVVLDHGGGEGFDLARPSALPPEGLPGDMDRADSVAHAGVFHAPTTCREWAARISSSVASKCVSRRENTPSSSGETSIARRE